jgi:hypothetical protein
MATTPQIESLRAMIDLHTARSKVVEDIKQKTAELDEMAKELVSLNIKIAEVERTAFISVNAAQSTTKAAADKASDILIPAIDTTVPISILNKYSDMAKTPAKPDVMSNTIGKITAKHDTSIRKCEVDLRRVFQGGVAIGNNICGAPIDASRTKTATFCEWCFANAVPLMRGRK